MRLAFGLSLVLLGALWLASTLGLREPGASQAAHWKNAPTGTQWRRTSHGWQRVDQVLSASATQRQPVTTTSLSPLVVAAMQVLVSVLALIVFPVAVTSRRSASAPTSLIRSPARQPVAKRRDSQRIARGATS